MGNKDSKELVIPQVLPPAIQERVNAYAQQKYNILMPVITTNRPDIHYALEIIHVSANPEDKQIYRMSFWKQGEYAFTKQTLLMFALAAGITWKPGRRLDKYGDRNYVCMQETACMTKPDGTLMEFTATKEIDLILEEEKLRYSYEKNGKTGEELEKAVQRDMIQLRTHKLSLCETKAKLRAIRGLLGLPSTFKQSQVSKPYVIPRLDFFRSLPEKEQERQVAETAELLWGGGPAEGTVGKYALTPKPPEPQVDNSPPGEPEKEEKTVAPTFEARKADLAKATSKTYLNYQWKLIKEDATITTEQGQELSKVYGKRLKELDAPKKAEPEKEKDVPF